MSIISREIDVAACLNRLVDEIPMKRKVSYRRYGMVPSLSFTVYSMESSLHFTKVGTQFPTPEQRA